MLPPRMLHRFQTHLMFPLQLQPDQCGAIERQLAIAFWALQPANRCAVQSQRGSVKCVKGFRVGAARPCVKCIRPGPRRP